jgi:hypothetical protein
LKGHGQIDLSMVGYQERRFAIIWGDKIAPRSSD